jgi:hypothetical protein
MASQVLMRKRGQDVGGPVSVRRVGCSKGKRQDLCHSRLSFLMSPPLVGDAGGVAASFVMQ